MKLESTNYRKRKSIGRLPKQKEMNFSTLKCVFSGIVSAEMTPDELWEKYCKPEMIDNHFYDVMREKDFLAALTEYGESVRAEAVKVLEDNWFKTQSDCAAAIKEMKLP